MGAPRLNAAAPALWTTIEIVDDVESARADWAALEALGLASPYQSLVFCDVWSAVSGPRATPLLALARDAKGEAVALLPLALRRIGPWRFASFQGGRMANYQMGLFREPERWTAEDARALVAQVLARAKLDALWLSNQPRQWRGAANPLAALGGRDSPSFAYATALGGDFETWTRGHFSTASRKKRRAKTRRLAALGPVSHRRADAPSERRAALDAFFAQKSARMRFRGLPNEFDEPANVALVERLAALDPSLFELHVLQIGERCAAVFGGLNAHNRLSGMIFSHDVAGDVAPMSPGEGLIAEIVRDGFARGLAEFDLGVGEARYKSECCEIAEPLFDSAFAATLSGRVAAAAFLGGRALKRRIKRAPRLFDLARVLQRWGVRLRVR